MSPWSKKDEGRQAQRFAPPEPGDADAIQQNNYISHGFAEMRAMLRNQEHTSAQLQEENVRMQASYSLECKTYQEQMDQERRQHAGCLNDAHHAARAAQISAEQAGRQVQQEEHAAAMRYHEHTRKMHDFEQRGIRQEQEHKKSIERLERELAARDAEMGRWQLEQRQNQQSLDHWRRNLEQEERHKADTIIAGKEQRWKEEHTIRQNVNWEAMRNLEHEEQAASTKYYWRWKGRLNSWRNRNPS